MDFRDNPAQAAWRAEVRGFLEAEKDSRPSNEELEGLEVTRNESTALKQWRQKLGERGWIAPAWPKEYGGAGLGVMDQFILNEEFAESRAPMLGGQGPSMVGPTIIVHGSDELKREFLPRILRDEIRWCQGYSEPGSGSDLASLQTRAVRDGDDFVINGQKIWTSGAHVADWMFLLARTDPEAPKHRGITYFLLDMKTPGISVRPLINMANQHGFNETFFEDVRVPARNIIGEVNRGWYVGATTLDFERSSVGNAVGQRQSLEYYIRHVKEHKNDGTINWNTAVRTAFAERWIEAATAKMMSYRVASLQAEGRVPNYEASICKLYNTELTQRIAGLAVKMLGLGGQVIDRAAAPLRGRAPMSYMSSVAMTIAGGTSEIQRNIVATRGLGLPRA
jgi:alkylation response protein AidB-like acyl-CoA dehydrogenase